jgi:hypothetical protein
MAVPSNSEEQPQYRRKSVKNNKKHGVAASF